MGQGKNPKFPVSLYFHIYVWWVILGYVKVNKCPVGLENWPHRARATLIGAENMKKATVK